MVPSLFQACRPGVALDFPQPRLPHLGNQPARGGTCCPWTGVCAPTAGGAPRGCWRNVRIEETLENPGGAKPEAWGNFWDGLSVGFHYTAHENSKVCQASPTPSPTWQLYESGAQLEPISTTGGDPFQHHPGLPQAGVGGGMSTPTKKPLHPLPPPTEAAGQAPISGLNAPPRGVHVRRAGFALGHPPSLHHTHVLGASTTLCQHLAHAI